MSLIGFKAQNHTQQVRTRGAKDAVDDRGTDQAYFDWLEGRFGKFDTDVAASSRNAKCERYYTVDDDGLVQPWVGRVWCNPPYSNLNAWLEKAWMEWRTDYEHNNTDFIAMLLPANRTEQAWWQDHVEPYRDRPGSSLRVEFQRGRMRFDRPDAVISPKGDRPPFGCCLLTWGPRWA